MNSDDSACVPAALLGSVVYFFAFDLAYELKGPLPNTLLGQERARFSMDSSRRAPRHLLFFKPDLLVLPPEECAGPKGALPLETTVKILPIGAVSIAVRVPFEVGTLADLVGYHDLALSGAVIAEHARILADRLAHELAAVAVRPVGRLVDDDPYTVFCLDPAPERSPAEAWLERNRTDVAALLAEEPSAGLSQLEVGESTGVMLTYYEDDLLVIDWDAALLIDDPADRVQSLHIIEIANLQLTELEAYDRLLDSVLERTYRDLAGRRSGRRRADVLREVRELQIDMTRFHDELSNITKFFGDWHLARVYAAVSGRFHLADWHASVDRKLRTLGELHQLMKSDLANRWMLMLEVTIVALFILDVALLLLGRK